MGRLLLTRTFQKSFERPDSGMQQRVKQVLLTLKEDSSAGKQLTGDLAGEWSLRVGSYRVIYSFDGDDIWLETVRHRKDVYKRK